MRVSILLIALATLNVAPAQIKLQGKIEQQSIDKWGDKLYILRIDKIGLNKLKVYDSIFIKKDGSFSYEFLPDPQGILYQIFRPLKNKPINFSLNGFLDHLFYIAPEDKGEVKLIGYSDSLYYSSQITKGNINKKLLVFRDLKRPIENIARAATDSIQLYPNKKDYFKEKFLKLTLSEAAGIKKRIEAILDTTKNTTITLAGLVYLNEANFGNLSGSQIKKYGEKLADDKVLLIRNVKKAVYETERNRIGIVLPDIELTNNLDKKIRFDAIKGKLKVLDFWASWCGPCRNANKNQLPKLNAFLGQNQIPLIGISIDSDKIKWKKAIKKDQTSWPQFMDTSNVWINLLNVQGVPAYLVLGESNEVLFESVSPILIESFIKSKI
ncbi:MAG: TlpA family protein disulfide reductase [Bacteroidota bacterium]